MKLFSQTAFVLTIPEFTESAAENLLFHRTDLVLVTHTQRTSTLHESNRAPLQASNLYMVIYMVINGSSGNGNLFPATGLYASGRTT
jgi:hypothetical protein